MGSHPDAFPAFLQGEDYGLSRSRRRRRSRKNSSWRKTVATILFLLALSALFAYKAKTAPSDATWDKWAGMFGLTLTLLFFYLLSRVRRIVGWAIFVKND